ncbi:MAG: 3-isopropylmalate dehydrogenase [Gammaproteobacteria bacterium]|nr:3-isopropylmalate dehydrogenase [Gammaproteobacteria bacterium]
MSQHILVLPGDGIGPEIVAVAERVLDALVEGYDLNVTHDRAAVGGAGYDEAGDPLPADTLARARAADAVLFGAIGGPRWDNIERAMRPERGLLRLRAELGLFCNLRPAILHGELADASTLKPEVVRDLDIMIVRELTGGIYFGQPRGIETDSEGNRFGYNTLRYTEQEIERIARVAFDVAGKRSRRLCSVDKANVLECTELWREVVTKLAPEYPDVELEHMYVDNAAMQLVREPKRFDVVLTTNLFGDILSDLAAMLTGSIGMLPSASLDASGKGLYEPVHGSAPDIAGQDIANPLATVQSLAMLLRYSLHAPDHAGRVERAVGEVLQAGYRTADIMSEGRTQVGTAQIGDLIVDALRASGR